MTKINGLQKYNSSLNEHVTAQVHILDLYAHEKSLITVSLYFQNDSLHEEWKVSTLGINQFTLAPVSSYILPLTWSLTRIYTPITLM